MKESLDHIWCSVTTQSVDTTQYLTVTAGNVEKIWKIGESCSPLSTIRLVVSNHVFISLN